MGMTMTQKTPDCYCKDDGGGDYGGLRNQEGQKAF